ncbi:hypothetical protein MMC29_008303 [Sticta canariensis]|nr:hypothetical protein [Sticta canariensis]
MQLLLDHKADVHIEDEIDDSSLHAGAVIQLLLNHGADAKATDNMGDTALHKLAKWHSAALVPDSRGNGVAEYLVVNPENQKVGTATVGAKAARQYQDLNERDDSTGHGNLSRR